LACRQALKKAEFLGVVFMDDDGGVEKTFAEAKDIDEAVVVRDRRASPRSWR
jgi:hypothetical protein